LPPRLPFCCFSQLPTPRQVALHAWAVAQLKPESPPANRRCTSSPRSHRCRLAVQGVAAAWLAHSAVPGSRAAVLARGGLGATAASAVWLLAAFPGAAAAEGSDETKTD
jgi:hypothetical protein